MRRLPVSLRHACWGRYRRSVLGALVCGLLVGGGVSALSADELVLRSGKTVQGFPRIEGREVIVNVYGCSAPEMTLGLRRLRVVDVRETRPLPVSDFLQRRHAELGPSDIPRRLELMREAQSAREKDWAERLAEEVLVRDPKNAEALKVVGGAEKWSARRRGDPRLDPRLARDVRRLLRRESGSERRIEAARLAQRHGYEPGADVIERMVRSVQADRGVRADQVVQIGAADHPGGRYTLFVPAAYDGLEPLPMLIALHGGGIRYEKGASTRGSANDALAHYLEGARSLGWFLLCPTAVEAPWDTSANAAFLEDVVAEVMTLWNVDLDRVHLAGQGGGADGAWYFGARKAEAYASVGIAGGGKPSGVASITGKTALWIYHGEADTVVPVEPVRKVAESLLRSKADFVYCELPKEGHGLAPAARRDYFRFIAPKRRRRASSAWPRSSFSEPSTKEAIAVFGSPAAAWGLGLDPKADAAALFEILAAGRTDAEAAARRLQQEFAAAQAEFAPRVRALVRDTERRAAARVWAAWLCGAWGDQGAINELGDTLRTSGDARLLRYAAEAVARLGSADSTQDLRWALSDVSKRFLAVPGTIVPYQDFERACLVGAALAEAIGRCVTEPDELFAELEEMLVRNILLDRREIAFVAENGEDPSEPRSRLVEELARAYRRLDAEKTLFEMLQLAVKNDPVSAQALLRGMRLVPR